MTDTQKLKKIIQDSGLKQEYIATQLGLSSYGFARKRDNLSEFTASEIEKLCGLLGIKSWKDRAPIFFAKEEDCKSTTEEGTRT